MTPGNERDLAREKKLKNKSYSASETEVNKGLSLQERQGQDATKMYEKQQRTEQKKLFPDRMNASFLRRHKQFLINIKSAACLLALGDYCAQTFYEKKKAIDRKRLLAACLTGAVMGLQGHVWYGFLDRVFSQLSWRNILKKVLLDQTIAAPIYTTTYILGTSILEGRTSLREVKKDTIENFLTLYLADCLVFIPTQVINFRYIPRYYRVPFMFSISFVFNAFLSAFKHTHGE